MAYTQLQSDCYIVRESFSQEEKLAAQTFAADHPYTRLEVSLKCEKLIETHVFADGNIEPPRKDWKCPANSRRPWHASRGQAWPPPCDVKYTPPPGSNAWMPLRNGTVLQALYCKTPADTEKFRTSSKDKAKCKHEIRFRDVADVVRDQRYQKRKNYYFFAFDDCSEFKFDVRVAGPPRPPGLHPAARPATEYYELRLRTAEISIGTWQSELRQLKLVPKKKADAALAPFFGALEEEDEDLDSDEEEDRRERARWGAACPYADIGVTLHQWDEEAGKTGDLETREESHTFTEGSVKPPVDKWKCPSEVEYKPPAGKSEWFTVSDDCSIVGGFGVDVREHPMFDHEMNYDVDCGISIDSGDVLRVLREREPDEKKWAKKKSKPYNFVAGCWFGGSASFDVKVEDNDDEWVFKLRLREANFSIGDWGDILGRLQRRPKKAPEPKRPLKQLAKKPARKRRR